MPWSADDYEQLAREPHQRHIPAEALARQPMLSVTELRAKCPFRPFEIARLNGKNVECVSYPFETDAGNGIAIMVRLTPGDSGTMEQTDGSLLEKIS